MTRLESDNMLKLANFDPTSFLDPDPHDKASDFVGAEELTILSVYRSSGLPWAKAALREAMLLAVESPSLMVVQALQCIQIYWFGIGESKAGCLCLGQFTPQ